MAKTYHAGFVDSITSGVIDLSAGSDHLSHNRRAKSLALSIHEGELP